MAMKVTRLSGTDYPATEESYAQVVWLLEKYSSWTYINRLYQLFATFVREYFDYASRGQHEGKPQFYRETLIRLYDYQARLERGLALLGNGDRSGCREIWTGCDFVAPSSPTSSSRFPPGGSCSGRTPATATASSPTNPSTWTRRPNFPTTGSHPGAASRRHATCGGSIGNQRCSLIQPRLRRCPTRGSASGVCVPATLG
jgi:hypothetical protein